MKEKYINSEIKIRDPYSLSDRLGFLKITAIWAFSESAFGGILHALTIPLRGLFISSAAVLFISLIALFSRDSKDILKATLVVILIKAVVSPHSPLAAYFAVSFQGFLGFILFSTKRFYKLSALLLGIIVLSFSGIQKIVLLTILFGNTLWQSLDLFVEQVSAEIFNISHPDINYGYLLVGAYIALHLAGGFFIGIYASRLPKKINHYKQIIPSEIEDIVSEEFSKKNKENKKSWFLRPTRILIILLSVGVILLSYVSSKLEENVAVSVVLMLVRAVVITFVWYSFLAPLARKLLQKFVRKRKSKYSRVLEEIISMFPKFRKIVNYCWKYSEHKKGIKRIRYFLSISFYSLLLTE